MAAKEDRYYYGKREFLFLEVPEDACKCLICMDPAVNPHQSKCCGCILCEKCVRKVETCPKCRKETFCSFMDQVLNRRIRSLKVSCPNSECNKKSDLGTILEHLREKCPFELVECRNGCLQKVERDKEAAHAERECSHRVIQCDLCEQRGPYQFITSTHLGECMERTVSCPEACGNEVRRRELSAHMIVCPEVVISCPYRPLGCAMDLKRGKMHVHLETHASSHVTFLTEKLGQQEGTVQELMRKVEQQEQDTDRLKMVVEQLVSDNKKLAEDAILAKVQIETLSSHTPVPSLLSYLETGPNGVVVRMSAFSSYKESKEWWYSQPFHVQPTSYLMCLKVSAHGRHEAEGSHISVYLNMMKGPYDRRLRFPIQGIFRVAILNQLSDYGHSEDDIRYTLSVPLDASGRVTEGDVGVGRAVRGHGIHKFMPHTYLSANTAVQGYRYYYNAHNVMYFRISFIEMPYNCLMEEK